MEQLLRRIKQLETITLKESSKKRIEDMAIKQKSDFATLKKSLVGTVEKAVESMKLGMKIHQKSELLSKRQKEILKEKLENSVNTKENEPRQLTRKNKSMYCKKG